MRTRAILVSTAIGILALANLWRYGASGGDERQAGNQDVRPFVTGATLPALNFGKASDARPKRSERDIFSFRKAAPIFASPVLEAPIAKPLVEPVDTREVATEAARVNMLNVNVTGILSSQSGLSAMVNAPFFEGIVGVGTEIGNGIVVEAINARRVRISHSELQLQRDIAIDQ